MLRLRDYMGFESWAQLIFALWFDYKPMWHREWNVVVWIKMVPTSSYIWMFRECCYLRRLEGVDFVGVGVAFLVRGSVSSLGLVLGISEVQIWPRISFFLLLESGYKSLSISRNMSFCVPSWLCHDNNGLNI